MKPHSSMYPEDFDPAKPEKPRLIIPVLIWAVIIGLAIGAALYAGKVYAAPVFRAIGDDDGKPMALRLLITPCGDKVKPHLAKVNPRFVPKLKAAILTWGGKNWASCWVEVNGTVYSIDEEGSFFQPIPTRLFIDDAV